MRKIMSTLAISLLFACLLSACSGDYEQSESSESYELPRGSESYELSGQYVQSDETKYDPSVIASHLSLYDDNSCEFVVNYLQGLCVTKGTYTVEGDMLTIELSESDPEGFLGEKFVDGTESHIAYQHTFTILDEETLSINEEVYAVQKDELFVKKP